MPRRLCISGSVYLQDQKVKNQGHGAGAYCGGHLAAQLVNIIIIIIIIIIKPSLTNVGLYAMLLYIRLYVRSLVCQL